jgi:hypothetical protein
MQLLNVGVAKSVWLFDINDLNPTGRMIYPEFLNWLGEKYSFQSYPKSVPEMQKAAEGEDNKNKGIAFKTGTFKSANVNLSIHTDGVVVETWTSTEISDEFIEDALQAAVSEFKLYFSPEIVRKKVYYSELNVRLDIPLANINTKITGYSRFLTGLFERHNLPPFEMIGISFAPDANASSYKPPGFVIERKSGAPFSENRFWSKSPFPTQAHLAALAAFEEQVLKA